MEIKWWEKIIIPMRKVWSKVAKRIEFRKNGLVKLHQEVRSCEYEDVHILWEMLKRNEIDLSRSRKESSWKFHWANCAPLLCRSV